MTSSTRSLDRTPVISLKDLSTNCVMQAGFVADSALAFAREITPPVSDIQHNNTLSTTQFRLWPCSTFDGWYYMQSMDANQSPRPFLMRETGTTNTNKLTWTLTDPRSASSAVTDRSPYLFKFESVPTTSGNWVVQIVNGVDRQPTLQLRLGLSDDNSTLVFSNSPTASIANFALTASAAPNSIFGSGSASAWKVCGLIVISLLALLLIAACIGAVFIKTGKWTPGFWKTHQAVIAAKKANSADATDPAEQRANTNNEQQDDADTRRDHNRMLYAAVPDLML